MCPTDTRQRFIATTGLSCPDSSALTRSEAPSPVFFQEWFSRYSKTGTVGDPTKATREKGQKFVEAVVERMIALLKEFRMREIRPRVDHH